MLSRISIQILCSTSAGQGWADTSAPVEQMVGWRGGLGISGMGWIICGQSWHPSGRLRAERARPRSVGCALLVGIGTEAIAGASWSSTSSSSSPSSLSQVTESAGRQHGRYCLWVRWYSICISNQTRADYPYVMVAPRVQSRKVKIGCVNLRTGGELKWRKKNLCHSWILPCTSV